MCHLFAKDTAQLTPLRHIHVTESRIADLCIPLDAVRRHGTPSY